MMEGEKRGIGTDVVILTVTKVITLCVSLITAMILTRYATYIQYGTYSQMILVVNLAASLLMLGLPYSINYFLSRAENSEERITFL